MENSKAYKYLIEQINATGSKRMDGYYPYILEEIYDWEREKAENIIWDGFCKKQDTDLALFLPKLRKHNGIEALKNALTTYLIPSSGSVKISQVLYQVTEDEKYLDIIKQNIDKKTDEISFVAALSHCKPCKKAYDLLVDIYVNSNDEVIRSTAVTGILYNKGIIKDPLGLQELEVNIEVERKFDLNDSDERRKIIKKLENGCLNC